MKRTTLFLILGLATVILVPIATGMTRQSILALVAKVHSPTYQNSREPMDIVHTRIIDATVEEVWNSWTRPDQIMRWWGARNFSSRKATVDLREGGSYLFHMRAPAEQGNVDYYNTGTYSRVDRMRLLEFTQSIADSSGNKINPTLMGLPPDFPAEIEIALSFKSIGQKTELVVVESGWRPGAMRAISEIGLVESLDKLEKSLE